MTAATREDVSRLLNRVAFGATAADLDTWAGRPYEDLVDHLLDVPSDPAARAPNAGAVLHDYDGVDYLFRLDGDDDPVVHWLEVMRTTPYPLEERMTFFLHDHFATAIDGFEPGAAQVVRQVQALRAHCLGSFRDLLDAMTIDGAMLHWLDGFQNSAANPNENHARELMELFALGKVPQVYSEADVREAARILTGWRPDSMLDQAFDTALPFGAPPRRGNAYFLMAEHDPGTKVVLGRTIKSGGMDEYRQLLHVLLDQDVAPLWIARRMVEAFAYTPDTADLLASPDPLVDEVAASLRTTDWDLRAAMRTLMLSPRFRQTDRSRGQQLVRPPVDLAVHAARCLDLPFVDEPLLTTNVFTSHIDYYLRAMGQVPLYPPSVFGWPDGEHWLSTTGTAHRYLVGYAAATALLRGEGFVRSGTGARTLPDPGDLDAWAALVGLAGLSANTEVAIRDYLLSQSGTSASERKYGVLMLLLASPEWEVI